MRKRLTSALFALLLAILAPPPLAAQNQQNLPSQDPLLPRYQANATTSGAAKITVQALAVSGAVGFEEADIYCAAAQTATIYVNGTAATTTTLAVVGPIGPTASTGGVVSAFSASNVGTGTTLKAFPIPAGGILVLDMHAFSLSQNAGTGANLSIGVTGTCTIQIQWVNR
jgi:hypothetical protein